jgi:hypothetical protein
VLRIHTWLSADVRFPPRTRRHLMSYLNAGRCAVRAWEFDSTEKWTLRNLLAAVGGTSFFVVTQQKTARLSTFDIFHPPSSGQWHTNVLCIPSRKFHPEIMINNQQFTSHREHCFRFQFSRKLTYMYGFQVINKFITLLIYWFSRIFDVYVKLFTELSFHFRSTHQNLAFTQNIWWTGQLASSAVLRSVVNGGGGGGVTPVYLHVAPSLLLSIFFQLFVDFNFVEKALSFSGLLIQFSGCWLFIGR